MLFGTCVIQNFDVSLVEPDLLVELHEGVDDEADILAFVVLGRVLDGQRVLEDVRGHRGREAVGQAQARLRTRFQVLGNNVRG